MDMIAEPQKTAVIDVGSNSVRLVVYYGAMRAPLQFFNEENKWTKNNVPYTQTLYRTDP